MNLLDNSILKQLPSYGRITYQNLVEQAIKKQTNFFETEEDPRILEQLAKIEINIEDKMSGKYKDSLLKFNEDHYGKKIIKFSDYIEIPTQDQFAAAMAAGIRARKQYKKPIRDIFK